jgi:hypothetical protein
MGDICALERPCDQKDVIKVVLDEQNSDLSRVVHADCLSFMCISTIQYIAFRAKSERWRGRARCGVVFTPFTFSLLAVKNLLC